MTALVFCGVLVSSAESDKSPALVAAVLPGSRAVQVGVPATAFVTVINASEVDAAGVGISLKTSIPASFSFQATDSSTNDLTGHPNAPVDIRAGGRQTFVIAITPAAPFGPTVVEFTIGGHAGPSGVPRAPSSLGVSTLLLSASVGPVTDIIPIAATTTGNGIADLTVSAAVAMARATLEGSRPATLPMSAAFAVVTWNAGSAGDTITAVAGTGGVPLPLSLAVREIDPTSAAIVGGNAKFIAPGQRADFGVFATAMAPIPFDPAINRISVEFKDSSGVVRGSTSVAVSTRRGDLIATGADLFFNERFEGNGRTCGTCHRAENNLTLDPAFIATLPADDPLFVAEFNPSLAALENPRLMREFGLIVENVDGFDRPGVLRSVPHTLGLAGSVRSTQGPRTGWSGDGAPGDGSLRSFATGAVTQHFTKTLTRVAGVDFRLPTAAELDALEAFQLALGRQTDPVLPLPLISAQARRGQAIFLDDSLGKCNICHFNAGATVKLGGANLGNINFDTGVENLPDQPARLTGELVPIDGGFGRTPRTAPSRGFGDGTFNPPPLVEAADTPPFFHNNAVKTIEDAVAFYSSAAFNASPAVREIGGGISLDPGQVEAVAAFLRVLNALENIRGASELLEGALGASDPGLVERLLRLADKEIQDAVSVLAGAALHPDAVALLMDASALTGGGRVQDALAKGQAAVDRLRDR